MRAAGPSVSNAHDLLTVFDTAATRFGVRNERLLQRFGGYSGRILPYGRG
jgi:hypothetical protein